MSLMASANWGGRRTDSMSSTAAGKHSGEHFPPHQFVPLSNAGMVSAQGRRRNGDAAIAADAEEVPDANDSHERQRQAEDVPGVEADQRRGAEFAAAHQLPRDSSASPISGMVLSRLVPTTSAH